MAVVDPGHWFLPADRTPRTPYFTRKNSVTPLLDGKAYMAALHGVIAACDQSTSLLMSAWRITGDMRLNPTVVNGKLSGERFVDAVAAAAKRGCSVKALMYNMLGTEGLGPFRLAHVQDNMAFAGAVIAAGGDAILDGRLANPLASHHQKFIVATSKTRGQSRAFIGGIDVCRDRWDNPAHNHGEDNTWPWEPWEERRLAGWHDIQAQVEGPAVVQLWQAFRARWNDSRQANHHPLCVDFRGRTRIGDDAPDCPESGTIAVQLHQTLPAGVFPETGGAGESTIVEAHVRAIELAQHYIYIEDQYLWPCALVEPVEDSLRRGVHVVMVVARDDVPPAPALATISNRMRHEVVERLRKAGGDRFHMYHLERPNSEQIYVHAKLMIVDDCYVSIGSANFNGRSLTNDTEIEIGIVDETTVTISIAGVPDQKVCKFAHDLRKKLWAENFQQPESQLQDPIAALSRLWPAAPPATHQRAHPHHVKIMPLDIDPVAEYITTLITENLLEFPCIMLPPGLTNRSLVKVAVDAALRGPQCALLLKALEEAENPDFHPAIAALVGRPIAMAWREHWARRAAHAVHFVGKHTPVSVSDQAGQKLVESRNGVQIFQLADGRYHVVSHFAVPSIEAARAAAMAISGDAS